MTSRDPTRQFLHIFCHCYWVEVFGKKCAGQKNITDRIAIAGMTSPFFSRTHTSSFRLHFPATYVSLPLNYTIFKHLYANKHLRWLSRVGRRSPMKASKSSSIPSSHLFENPNAKIQNAIQKKPASKRGLNYKKIRQKCVILTLLLAKKTRLKLVFRNLAGSSKLNRFLLWFRIFLDTPAQ